MLELVNKTPFCVNFTPVVTREGFDALSIYMAASFESRAGNWHLCEQQMPSPFGDALWDETSEDGSSSIRYPSQLSFDKPATDLIVNGVAVAPNQQACRALETSIEILDRKVVCHVLGDRVWQRGSPSEPKPFQRIPLVWENAFGGRHQKDDEIISCEHNPYGKGWKIDKTPDEAYQGEFLPNIEWPNQRIQGPSDRPRPAGFAALSVAMAERSRHAGSYDEAWRKQRSPFMPHDFDPHFFNAAIPELQFKAGLQGGESIRLTHLNEQSEVIINLPLVSPLGRVNYAQQERPLNFNLITVLIESETLVVRMFWQAMAPIYRSLADVKAIHTSLARTAQREKS